MRAQTSIGRQYVTLAIAGHAWRAPIDPAAAEPWFRYVRGAYRAPAGSPGIDALPEHLRPQALRIWRRNNPASVAALFRRCAPDYRADNDPWGHAMSVYFDVAAWLDEHGTRVEGYRPGAAGSFVESEDIRAELDEAGPGMVQRLARFCDRLTGALRRAGRDY